MMVPIAIQRIGKRGIGHCPKNCYRFKTNPVTIPAASPQPRFGVHMAVASIRPQWPHFLLKRTIATNCLRKCKSRPLGVEPLSVPTVARIHISEFGMLSSSPKW